jgi:hypothetical protein
MSNRILLLVIITIVLCSALEAFASAPVLPVATAIKNSYKEEIQAAIGKAGQMNLADLENRKGEHLTIMEKALFRKMQTQLADRYAHMNAPQSAPELELKNGEKIDGWVWGFLMGALGLLTAYLINDKRRQYGDVLY